MTGSCKPSSAPNASSGESVPDLRGNQTVFFARIALNVRSKFRPSFEAAAGFRAARPDANSKLRAPSLVRSATANDGAKHQ